MSELVEYIKAENAKSAAWVAEDPQNRWSGMIVEDAEHWAECGVYTVAQYRRYMDEETFAELNKDVTGSKHHGLNLSEMSDEEFYAEYDRLIRAHDAEMARHTAAQAQAVKDFEEKIQALTDAGAGNRETALRWYKDSLDEFDRLYGNERIEYLENLPYGYLKQQEAA